MTKIVTKEIKGKTVSYEYRGKAKKYDSYIQLRIEKEKKQKLIELAKESGFNSYSSMLKSIIDCFLIDPNKQQDSKKL